MIYMKYNETSLHYRRQRQCSCRQHQRCIHLILRPNSNFQYPEKTVRFYLTMSHNCYNKLVVKRPENEMISLVIVLINFLYNRLVLTDRRTADSSFCFCCPLYSYSMLVIRTIMHWTLVALDSCSVRIYRACADFSCENQYRAWYDL